MRTIGEFRLRDAKAKVELEWGIFDDADALTRPNASAHSYLRYVCCISGQTWFTLECLKGLFQVGGKILTSCYFFALSRANVGSRWSESIPRSPARRRNVDVVQLVLILPVAFPHSRLPIAPQFPLPTSIQNPNMIEKNLGRIKENLLKRMTLF